MLATIVLIHFSPEGLEWRKRFLGSAPMNPTGLAGIESHVASYRIPLASLHKAFSDFAIINLVHGHLATIIDTHLNSP